MAVTLLVSCGATTASFTASATKFNVATDGFLFANFGSANTTESMTAADLSLMFGDGVCSRGTGETCTPTAEGLAWMQMVNASRQAGHCEGLAVLAEERFTAATTPHTATLVNEGTTTHAIIRAFATQFLPKVEKDTARIAGQSIADKLSLLSGSFAAGRVGYTMGLYTEAGGHAVLPYAMSILEDRTVRLKVYDSNWPGKDRWVDVDPTSGEWTFSFSSADPASDPRPWTGSSADFDLTPFDSRLNATAPFDSSAHVRGSFLVIKSAVADWSISTGTTTYTSDSPGVRPVRGGVSTVTDYVIALDDDKVEVLLPSTANAYVVTATSTVRIQSAGSSAPVAVSGGTVRTSDSAAVVSVASGDLAVSIRNLASTVDVSSSRLVVNVDSDSEQIVIGPSTGATTVSSDGSRLVSTAGSSITTADPALPALLLAPDTKAGLPTQDVRAAEGATTTTTTTEPRSTSSTTSTTTATKSTTTTTSAAPTFTALQFMNAVGAPSSGQPLAQLKVWLVNASGQRTQSNATVSVTLETTGGGAAVGVTLSGTLSRTASAGEALFPDLVLTGASGSYRLRFVSGNVSTLTPQFVLSP